MNSSQNLASQSQVGIELTLVPILLAKRRNWQKFSRRGDLVALGNYAFEDGWITVRAQAGENIFVNSRLRTKLADEESAEGRPAFVEVGSMVKARFELELRGRRLLIPDSFDPHQLRALVAILEGP